MIRIFFGNPGCGKTTLAVRNFYKLQCQKKPLYDYYFSNFVTDVANYVSLKDLGLWSFPDYSFICIDESGIEYNSRKYKDLSQDTIKYFKLHRHFHNDIDFYSQSWEDMDVTIRRLADELWYVRKLGPFSLVRRIHKKVGIDDNTHQIIDEYRFARLIKKFLPFPFHENSFFFVFRPRWYRYFNSFSRPSSIFVPGSLACLPPIRRKRKFLFFK